VGSEFGVWSLGFAPECCTEQEAAAAAPHGMDTNVQPAGLDTLRRNRENLWPSEYFGFRVQVTCEQVKHRAHAHKLQSPCLGLRVQVTCEQVKHRAHAHKLQSPCFRAQAKELKARA